jgi:signal transduction histidine kinase
VYVGGRLAHPPAPEPALDLHLAFSVTTIAVSATVALVAARVATVPGWEAQRWLARGCAAMVAYAALSLPHSASPAGPLGALQAFTPAVVRVQLFLAAANLWIWMRYADVYLGTRPRRAWRAMAVAVLAVAVLWLVPGVGVGTAYTLRPVGDGTLADPVRGPVADLLTGVMALAHVALVVRFVGAWRAGVPTAALHAVAFAVFLALGVHDALAWRYGLPAPYLVDLGGALPGAVIGLLMALRLVREARAAAELRRTLEAQVEVGMQDLARSREALHRAEKLAAVGELAAGIAHEVNNPAAAAHDNVVVVLEHLEELGHPPPDAVPALRDALGSLDRIADIVRRLTGASRLATSGAHPHRVPLAPVIRESLLVARARCPDHVRLEQGPCDDVAAFTDAGLVEQVLVNLVVNGAQAVPRGRDGRVAVSAAVDAARIVIVVEDDGQGMAPEVLARVFEPFFTTKPAGEGTGLGLSISRGLVAAVGGTLRLESEAGRGTRAIVELPAVARAAA